MNKLPQNSYKKHVTLFAFIALFTATTIWAGALPIIKITQLYIPPFTFLFFRFLVVCLVMLPFMFFELKSQKIDFRDLKKIALLGILSQTGIAFIFWGLKYATALDTAIIGTIGPLLTIAAGHYFYHEKISKTARIGILVATIGTAIVVLEPVFSNNSNAHQIELRIFGNLLVLAYFLMFTAYVIFSKAIMGTTSKEIKSAFSFLHIKPFKEKYSPVLHTSLSFYVGLLTMIPFALAEQAGIFGTIEPFKYSDLTLVPLLGILYMAILSSIVAYIAYEWGLENAEVSDGALFGYLGPIMTLPFAYFLLNELPTHVNLFGGVIIAIGVFIAEKYKGQDL